MCFSCKFQFNCFVLDFLLQKIPCFIIIFLASFRSVYSKKPYAPTFRFNGIPVYDSFNKNFLLSRKDFFKEIECKVTVITTGEQMNKAVILQSLSEIMRAVIASFNPNTGEFGVLADPVLSKVFNQIVELSGSGISPVSLGKGARPTKQVPQQTTTPVPTPESAPLAA